MKVFPQPAETDDVDEVSQNHLLSVLIFSAAESGDRFPFAFIAARLKEDPELLCRHALGEASIQWRDL
jgi:hypothetical protein